MLKSAVNPPRIATARVEFTTREAVTSDPRWLSVRKRDSQMDDAFVYSVKTTGVYCRPSCGARLANPENVAFHLTSAAAEHAGFRPCKRCRPDQIPLAQRQAALVADLCRFIETREAIPSLAELSKRAGLSSFHTHRLFKAVCGVTPNQYAIGRRAQRVRTELRERDQVTEAIHSAGYNSSSRFYEQSNTLLGMTPTQYRTGGADLVIHFALGACPLGTILVATTRVGICAILLGDGSAELVHELELSFPKARLVAADSGFETLVARTIRAVQDPNLAASLPLDIRGTAFQQQVWNALREIPVGHTTTYAEVARSIGNPKATRAVARACAANSIAVAIPCHRVVRSDGSLSGYRWGVKRKQALLEQEAQRRETRAGAVPHRRKPC